MMLPFTREIYHVRAQPSQRPAQTSGKTPGADARRSSARCRDAIAARALRRACASGVAGGCRRFGGLRWQESFIQYSKTVPYRTAPPGPFVAGRRAMAPARNGLGPDSITMNSHFSSLRTEYSLVNSPVDSRGRIPKPSATVITEDRIPREVVECPPSSILFWNAGMTSSSPPRSRHTGLVASSIVTNDSRPIGSDTATTAQISIAHLLYSSCICSTVYMSL